MAVLSYKASHVLYHLAPGISLYEEYIYEEYLLKKLVWTLAWFGIVNMVPASMFIFLRPPLTVPGICSLALDHTWEYSNLLVQVANPLHSPYILLDRQKFMACRTEVEGI
jgi:hypothetical protein